MIEVLLLNSDRQLNRVDGDRTVRKSLGRKGIYEIVTTFILIIIIVVAVIGFIALYGLVFKTQGGSTKKSDELMTAKSFYSELLSQHSKTMLLEKKLESIEPTDRCITYLGVTGYEIKQDVHYGCVQKQWSCGKTEEFVSRTPYWVIVQQNDTSTCLAKLYVYQG